MSPKTIVRLVQTYRGLVPEGNWAEEDRGGTSLSHILFMCDAMERAVADGTWPEGKLMRWLGWLQCLMATHGLRTLTEMREDNRHG